MNTENKRRKKNNINTQFKRQYYFNSAQKCNKNTKIQRINDIQSNL